jgi:hypothetical protein
MASGLGGIHISATSWELGLMRIISPVQRKLVTHYFCDHQRIVESKMAGRLNHTPFKGPGFYP